MDKSACLKASDEDLCALGLIYRGDIIHLKGFCLLNTMDNDQETELKVALAKSSKERTATGSQKKQKNNRLQFKTLYLLWAHFNKQKNRHVSVRTSNGGGTRTAQFSHNSTYDNILKEMKNLFFPNGISKFGREDQMKFRVGNQLHEYIDGSESFILSECLKRTKYSKTKFVLLSEKMTSHQYVMSYGVNNQIFEREESPDFDVLPSFLRPNTNRNISTSSYSSSTFTRRNTASSLNVC